MGGRGRTVLRSNSLSARGVSHCFVRLSQKAAGVRYRRWALSFRRFVNGGARGTAIGSTSDSVRFRVLQAGVESKGIGSRGINGRMSKRIAAV